MLSIAVTVTSNYHRRKFMSTIIGNYRKLLHL